MPEDQTDVAESQDDSTAEGTEAPSLTLANVLDELDEDRRGVVLEAVRKARQKENEARRALAEVKNELKATQAKAVQGQSAEEQAQATVAAAQEREQALRNRLVSAEVRALATAQFNDPEDAIAFLDLGSFVNESGEVDTEAIRADLDELLTRKPHLRKVETAPGARRPNPDPSQGAGSDKALPLNGDPLLNALQAKLGIPR